jgi:hypothetical protein
LKIPKGQSESVYRRRTENTMPKVNVQKDKQRSTKHTYKNKDRVKVKIGGELMRSERIVVKLTFEFILPLLETYHLIYITLVRDIPFNLYEERAIFLFT